NFGHHDAQCSAVFRPSKVIVERVKARPQSILQDRNILSLPRVGIDAGSPAKPVSFKPSRKPGVRCAIAADEPAYRYSTVGIAGCCARAAPGAPVGVIHAMLVTAALFLALGIHAIEG